MSSFTAYLSHLGEERLLGVRVEVDLNLRLFGLWIVSFDDFPAELLVPLSSLLVVVEGEEGEVKTRFEVLEEVQRALWFLRGLGVLGSTLRPRERLLTCLVAVHPC